MIEWSVLSVNLTCSRVCWARSVVDIITPAANEPSSKLSPSLSLHWNLHNQLNKSPQAQFAGI